MRRTLREAVLTTRTCRISAIPPGNVDQGPTPPHVVRFAWGFSRFGDASLWARYRASPSVPFGHLTAPRPIDTNRCSDMINPDEPAVPESHRPYPSPRTYTAAIRPDPASRPHRCTARPASPRPGRDNSEHVVFRGSMAILESRQAPYVGVMTTRGTRCSGTSCAYASSKGGGRDAAGGKTRVSC